MPITIFENRTPCPVFVSVDSFVDERADFHFVHILESVELPPILPPIRSPLFSEPGEFVQFKTQASVASHITVLDNGSVLSAGLVEKPIVVSSNPPTK